jgi:hypothetical protein
MTAAERMRRYRAKRREPKAAPPDTLDGYLAGKTRKEQARYVGRSERYWYYLGAYQRHQAFEWDGDILNGKYGRCGMSFIAEVCKLADAEGQRIIHDYIKERGAPYARQIWRLFKRAVVEDEDE